MGRGEESVEPGDEGAELPGATPSVSAFPAVAPVMTSPVLATKAVTARSDLRSAGDWARAVALSPRGSLMGQMYDACMRDHHVPSLKLYLVGLFDRFKLPSVKPAEAQEMLRSGATFLDVRENAEWNAGHVPGAVHVPAKGVSAQAPKRLPKGRPVIVACKTGSRSRGATRVLREKGIEAYNLAGGLSAWESSGGRVVGKGNRPGTIA